MKILVIGGNGHIGSYLIPRLVQEGHDVISVSRGNNRPYEDERPEWDQVIELIYDRKTLCKDRALLEELAPDVICDIVVYNEADARQLCENFIGTDTRIIAVGSNWVFGHKLYVPVDEEHPRTEPEGYGRGKAELERYLMSLSAAGMLPCTVLHPGHVTGRGWIPVNPYGNFNRAVFQKIICGEPVLLPGDGMYTLQHIHAADLAELFVACIENPEASVGESFLATAPEALTQRGYVEMLCQAFHRVPDICYGTWEDFLSGMDARQAEDAKEHLRHSPVCSMEKARRLLNFTPGYHAFDAIMDALHWQIEKGFLTVGQHVK